MIEKSRPYDGTLSRFRSCLTLLKGALWVPTHRLFPPGRPHGKALGKFSAALAFQDSKPMIERHQVFPRLGAALFYGLKESDEVEEEEVASCMTHASISP